MKYKFADFCVEIKGVYTYLINECNPYLTEDENALLSMEFHEEEILQETEAINREGTVKTVPAEVEMLSAYRELAEQLPLHGAFLLHSAVIDVDGVGIAFAAHSGTGKTTHMLLWQKLLGDRLTVVNGDKPIIRFFESEPTVPYAYGTPWCGKEKLGCNTRTPVRHICFIERAAENSVERVERSEVVNLLFDQVYMPKDPAAMAATLQLMDRFLSACALWKIRCNMDISAAQTAYGTISACNFWENVVE